MWGLFHTFMNGRLTCKCVHPCVCWPGAHLHLHPVCTCTAEFPYRASSGRFKFKRLRWFVHKLCRFLAPRETHATHRWVVRESPDRTEPPPPPLLLLPISGPYIRSWAGLMMHCWASPGSVNIHPAAHTESIITCPEQDRSGEGSSHYSAGEKKLKDLNEKNSLFETFNYCASKWKN